MDHTCTIRISDEARRSLAAAYARWLDLPPRVFEACCQEAADTVYERFPRALWRPDHTALCQHCERVLRRLVAALRPEGTASVEAEPRQAVLVAACVIAYMYACLLPYREPLREVQVPEDFDAETLLDTIAVHCMNAFGQPVSESFGDTLAMVLRNALGSAEQTPSRRLSEDETQHVLGTALFASGGPTPGLVREIVREVETAKREGRKPKVPKDAEIPLRATAEEVARLHGKMENCHREDLIFAQLVACLEANSTPEDLVEGLQGQWLNVQNAIMPYVLPPEVSTAHLLLRSARRDTWTGDTLLAAQRVKWRFDRRARRQEKYFPSLELDAPAEIDGRQVDLHEIIPDASATIAPEGRLEEVLQAYGLTKQEQRVAVLRIWGYKQNEIARKMKVSAARVSQLMKAIGAKIGAQAGGDEKPRK